MLLKQALHTNTNNGPSIDSTTDLCFSAINIIKGDLVLIPAANKK